MGFPSIATSFPAVPTERACTHAVKQALNAFGSSALSTRRKVSALGMPCRRSKKVSSHSCLARPNSSMSSQPSPTQIIVSSAMIKMFGSGCSRVRSTRGSGTSSKKAKTPKYTGLSAFMLATKHRHRPNGKDSSVCQLKPIPQSKNKPTSAVQTYLSDGALALGFAAPILGDEREQAVLDLASICLSRAADDKR